MKISLQDFSSIIDSVIVSRGEEYFYDEAIHGLKEIKSGEWIASVEGTELYKVRVSLKGAGIYDYSCSCPYDMGPICKHVVAVLFALREKLEDDVEVRKGQKLKFKKTAKMKPTEETFEQLIVRMPREDLNAILIDYAGREPGLVDYISARRTIKAPTSDKEEYRQIVQNAVDAVRGQHGYKDDWSLYDYERATVIKMNVIERLDTKEEVAVFLNKHLDCTPLREHAIESTLKSKDYVLAKKLALDGHAQDKARGLPGLISKWTRHLLDIAEAQKDYPEVKKYSLQLFLDSNDFIFYDRYKKCFTGKEWPQEAQKIIDTIRHSKDGRNHALALPQIYIREERWLDLMDFVQESNSSWALENFTKHLAKHFPDKLADVYEKVIVEKLAPVMGRGNYQYVCQFLRRLQKLGDKDRAKRLVAELSEKYSNRPAMLEELRRV